MGTTDTAQDGWIQAAVGHYSGPLKRYATTMVGRERAEDVVQEVFARLCAQPPTALEGRIAGWLFTVCRNRALDVLRRDKRTEPLGPGERASPWRLPTEVAELKSETQRALDLLSTLAPNQQEVLRLKFQHGLSYREISEVTGLTVSNVGYLIHVGLKALRAQMREVR